MSKASTAPSNLVSLSMTRHGGFTRRITQPAFNAGESHCEAGIVTPVKSLTKVPGLMPTWVTCRFKRCYVYA